MRRAFEIHSNNDGKCTVRGDGVGLDFQFPGIIDAIAYVRRQRAGEKVKMTWYDSRGRVVVKSTL